MSAESTHLSTFGAETETEAEIRSTSSLDYRIHQTTAICGNKLIVKSTPIICSSVASLDLILLIIV